MKLPRLLLPVIVGLAAVAPLVAGQADHRLDIYWNDSEGGGSTLIVTPAGQSILIDSGNPGDRDAGRIFKTAKIAGLKKIDFYITTHFHADHYGGAARLSELIPIGQVYDNGIPDHDPDNSTPQSDALWRLASKPYRAFKADGRNVVHAGLILPLKGNLFAPRLQLRCVISRQHMIPAPVGAKPNPVAGENSHKYIDPSDNDNSNAWVLSFGAFRFFDGGDLTWNMEGALVTPVNRLGQVDVYQTDHHGLAWSNNPVFIHSLAPTVSVMNNGSTKGTAKPTIDGLKSSPGIQAMYQMHKNLRPGDPYDNTADAFIANFADDPNTCPGNYIKLSVDPSGKSYLISIPATGQERTYQTRLNKS